MSRRTTTERQPPVADPETLRVWSSARRARDARFDGRFFVAVRTTGIYCRPICPARTALERNVEYYPSAAAAAAHGYIACLRCRPETAAPRAASASASERSELVARALRLVEEGALDPVNREAEDGGGGSCELARRLEVSERTLRRAFLDELGATPAQIATTRRLHLARQLLLGSHLRCGDVAFAAGYGSVRRFNAAVRRTFGLSPARLREKLREQEPVDAAPRIRLALGYRPPLAWSLLLDFLAARAVPTIERVDPRQGVYRRWIEIGDREGLLTVHDDAARHRLRVELRLEPADGPAGARRGASSTLPSLVPLTHRLRELFDLAADPSVLEQCFADDPELGPRWQAAPGIRVPGCFDPFELVVRAVLGQQVTVRGATTLAGRLVERYGRPAAAADWRLFPSPQRLRGARLEQIGLPAARAECLRAGAAARADGGGFDSLRSAADNLERLLALPGIGPWTAHYVAMRALHDPDAFPDGDLVLRQVLCDGERPWSARQVRERAEAWRPARAYAAMLLWQVGFPDQRPTARRSKR